MFHRVSAIKQEKLEKAYRWFENGTVSGGMVFGEGMKGGQFGETLTTLIGQPVQMVGANVRLQLLYMCQSKLALHTLCFHPTTY